MLKKICEYAGLNEQYEEYLDGNIDRNELIETCQEKLDDDREVSPEYKEWLGI